MGQKKVHFTYTAPVGSKDLQQGDYIARSDEINGIISEIHPYYTKSDYLGFMVLTQTCDLVRRDDEPPLEYITLCAIRPIEAAINSELRKVQTNFVLRLGNAVDARGEGHVRKFLERLLNNNVEEYFYLHEDAELGIIDSSCAFLRLSIALKNLHYEACLRSRKACLTPEFQAKLGWHFGKIYNRVATKDWVPDAASKQEWTAILNGILQTHVVKLDDKQISELRANKVEGDLAGLGEEAIRDMVRQTFVKKRNIEVTEAVVNSLLEAGVIVDKDKKKVYALLSSNAIIKALK